MLDGLWLAILVGEVNRMATAITTIPRARFAATMAVSCAVAIAAGLFMAWRGGADADTLVAIGIALGVLASVCVVPLLGPPLVSDDSWGMVVLGTGAMRTMLALGAMLVLIEMQGLPRRPVAAGILTGAVMMMVAEAVAAVRLLAWRDRQKAALRGAMGTSDKTKTSSAGTPASSGSTT